MTNRIFSRLVVATIFGVMILVVLLALPATVTWAACAPKCPTPESPATFYNPNDGRLNPSPTDELAIWCNTFKTGPLAETIDVWEVDDHGVGQRMTTFTFAEIRLAGDNVLVHRVGEYTLTLRLLDRASNLFYIQCNGLIDGEMMSKTFTCPVGLPSNS